MSGPFDFLHIKGRTAGSSNELSFDVLDAARSDLDSAKKARTSSTPNMPRPSQGSYTGVKGTSTLSAVPEVERRKRVRRTRRIRVWVLAVILVVGLVAVGAFAGQQLYQNRLDFNGRFLALIDRFVEVDGSLAEVDSLMADPLNSVEQAKRAEALDDLPDLENELASIAQAARDLQPDATGDPDRAALDEVVKAAEARENMLDAADGAFTLSVVVNKQVSAANTAWNKVLAGDELAREAADEANNATTEEAVLSAADKTQQALDSMRSALSELIALEREVVGIDLSSERSYIEKRIEALDFALDTSSALMEGDRSAAVAANDAYNQADKQAVELARALPPSIGSQVRDQYADDMQRRKDAYSTARSAVIAADSALRSYLPH